MKINENLLLSFYLSVMSMLIFEVAYFLNFTIFSFYVLIHKYLLSSIVLSLLFEFGALFIFYLIYNQIVSKAYRMFNQIYKYVIFALIDYIIIVGLLKIFGILGNYLYLTTQICLISGLIIIKCMNLYSIFYANLLKYHRNKKKELLE